MYLGRGRGRSLKGLKAISCGVEDMKNENGIISDCEQDFIGVMFIAVEELANFFRNFFLCDNTATVGIVFEGLHGVECAVVPLRSMLGGFVEEP